MLAHLPILLSLAPLLLPNRRLQVADQVHALGLLRFMLTHLSHDGQVVSLARAAEVEACCLGALGWRLGPYFLEDELAGDDEALWCQGMGHWDYGTDADAL